MKKKDNRNNKLCKMCLIRKATAWIQGVNVCNRCFNVIKYNRELPLEFIKIKITKRKW